MSGYWPPRRAGRLDDDELALLRRMADREASMGDPRAADALARLLAWYERAASAAGE